MEDLLRTKHRLHFQKNGIFKILSLSDIQETTDFDPYVRNGIEKILDAVKPDLVLLGGDQCMGPDVHSVEEFQDFLPQLIEPLEARCIRWAHVFGNHDYDLSFDPLLQQSLYEAYPYCVSKHTEDIAGVTNFMLPIYRYASDEIGFAVWGLDTRCQSDAFFQDCGVEHVNEWTAKPFGMGRYDSLRFDQLMWYWHTSTTLELFAGRKIPSLMCMHIAPAELALAINNPDTSDLVGRSTERLDGGVLNSGIFSACLQRGDIACISCGHTHLNHFSANVYGITVCFDGTAGFRCYGDDESRGGRVFEISENDARHVKTYPVLYRDLR